MPKLSLLLLGEFQASIDGAPVTNFESDSVRALLAYLAIEADRAHQRGQLAALLWPDRPEKTARANLRHVLRKLRQALDKSTDSSAWLLTTRKTIQFNPSSNYQVDVTHFNSLLATCKAHEHQELRQCQTCRQTLKQAAALYAGDFLAGLSLPGNTPIEEWARVKQEQYHQQALETFYCLADYSEAAGNWAEAQQHARRQIAMEPWREKAHRQLMRALTYNAQRSAALAQYEKCRQVLDEELGVEPSAETAALYKQIEAGTLSPKTEISEDGRGETSPSLSHQDWGEAPDLGMFYGRQAELETLSQWLITDRCRLVAVLGMGGVGKTTLVSQVARALAGQFELVFWRSLLNAPPLSDILRSCLQFFAHKQGTDLPVNLDEQLLLLLDCLRQQRCLLVLDNMETIFQAGGRAGIYRDGYEDYGQLIQRIGQSEHQSCLLLTSRESPKEMTALQGNIVRSLRLAGLKANAGQELLAASGLSGPEDLTEALSEHHSGNPLALKLIAQTIQELFNQDIAAFLNEGAGVFDNIREVLDHQFGRLSRLEKEILIWLAIEREAISTQTLWGNLVSPGSRRVFLEALQSLQRRSLLESSEAGFTLQNVVVEYLTDYLVEAICQEIEEGQLDLFNAFSLLIARAKEYVRQSQVRLILTPIASQLTAVLTKLGLEKKLQHLLHTVQSEPSLPPGYAGGNILNLLLHLGISVDGYDFSHIPVWGAYLRGATLHKVNFAGADLAGSYFTDTFAYIRSVAFSPDGRLLAGGTEDGEIRLWQVADGQLVNSFKGQSSFVWSVAFSPDSTLLASGSSDETVRIWDIQTGRPRHFLSGHTDMVFAVAFSPDGTILASSSDDHTIRLWDMQTGKARHVLEGHTDWVRCIAFRFDGSVLASGSDDHTIRVWNVHSGQCEKVLIGHHDAVRSVSYCPDNKILASGSEDGMLHVWDIQTGKIRHTLHGHSASVRTLAFTPDGQTLASGSNDQTIRLWDVRAGQIQHTLQGHTNWVWSIALSPDGLFLASAGFDQTVHVWNFATRQIRYVLQGHMNEPFSIDFSPTDKLLASGHADHFVRLWDADTGQVRHTLSGHTQLVRSVAMDPNGGLLASAGLDEIINVWNVHTQQIRQILRGHVGAVFSVAFSPDGRLLASSGDDQSVRLWDIHTGQTRHVLFGHTEPVTCVAFSPDGDILASSSYDQTVRLWDVRTGKLRHTLLGHTEWIWSVAFSPDGNLLTSGGVDQVVRVWDIQIGETRHVLEGHTAWVRSVAFSPDGNFLASGGDDRTIRIWDVHSGQIRHVLQGHRNYVWSVVFSQDSKTLVSGNADGTIRLWDAFAGELRQTLEVPGPYAGMNIARTTGLTEAQKATLQALGAVEYSA